MKEKNRNKHPMEGLCSEEDLKTRKVFLNEYDEEGNLIESRELSDWHLKSVLAMARNYKREIDVLSISIKNKFSKKEWDLIEIIEKSILGGRMDFYDEHNINILKDLLNEPEEKIRFAADMSANIYKKYIPTLESPYPYEKIDFLDGIKFINSRGGIYYAVNNTGSSTCNFVDPPTRKQAEYRRKKYGDRIVFLSFEDWKEYIVHEDEL